MKKRRKKKTINFLEPKTPRTEKELINQLYTASSVIQKVANFVKRKEHGNAYQWLDKTLDMLTRCEIAMEELEP